ncbi:nitrile hydratase subunit beta [Rhodospirillaceae bacterium KN72]|uniref:Nitrile hydratase subunit beta n=1 Tax=Pacificispira spongiicola TaxID=2729598 RepID=A0A7Y0HEL4_9PROT|nr:nitrile hydratase subunit beta [Pacificispira spongiicola]NMM43057.1 nitrile hydratase subunit beta [Pacificispira spongiicola]
MNGPQDLGGRDGFGPVAPEQDEPLFHADWEKRAMAVTLAAGAMGHWTLDESRHAREDRDPVEYLSSSYYKIWIMALERLLIRHGLVTQDELAAGKPLHETAPPNRVLKADMVAAALAKGGPVDRDPGDRKPAFAVGDRVRTRNLQPTGHVRLPSYARDKVGTVEAVQGYHAFPDKSALGDRSAAEWIYTVTFDAKTLWGDRGRDGDAVSIDAWEPYLDHV